jgi:hypothetical protein
MTTYREGIRQLDRMATPPPWFCDGELYGVRENGSFMPFGFAPHRPLDARLIAVYRSAVMQMVDAVDAVAQLAARASTDSSAPAAIGISQILTILDAGEREGTSFRAVLGDLDQTTTPPLWDPGHLILGMEQDAAVRLSLGIATPRTGDRQLIAVARSAVPRALELLALAEVNMTRHGNLDGTLRAEGVLAIVSAVAAFDKHEITEGSGTGTV